MESRTSSPGAIPKRAVLFLATLIFFLLASFSMKAQDPAQYGSPFTGVPNRMDANIYQLNFREYTPQRTIVAAKNNMQRLKDLGINVIYLMPFTSVTTDPVKGTDRSPYSIKDLKAVDPELGTLQDIRDYVAQAHTLGMAVIYDFVPNQTAWDHPWITQHPDWYAKDASGAIRSPNAGTEGAPFLFTDVAELNLTNPTVVNAVIDAARYWIFAANFDGIRLDWADKAGQAFNNTFVTNMRSITTHNLLLLAEGSNEGTTSQCQTCGDNQPGAHWAQGFDYIYGTNFYWNVMKKVWKSGEPAKNLNDVTNVSVNGVSLGEYGSGTFTGFPTSTQLVARFLSSHDNYNEDGSPFAGNGNASLGGRNAVMSAFVVATYHRSVPFIYNGLEVGNTNPLPYPWRTGTINWTQDLTVYTEMQKILSVRNASVALRRGQPTSYIDPANTNPDIMAFTKISGTEKVVVLVNVRNSNKTFTIPSGMAGTYNNAFVAGGSPVTLTTGSVVTLTPYQYLVYTNANVPVVPVTGVTVSPGSASVKVGLTTQLTAAVLPSNATNQNISWSSSNTAVATVNSSGLVTGVATGTATITVTTADGNRTATSTITVTPATTFTVYFSKPASWGTDIRIYHWAAQPTGVLADAAWPGVTMTLGADGWYSYTFTNVTSTNLIFNANSDVNKTVDLTRGTTGWYLGSTWYNTKPAVPNSLTVSPASLSVGSSAGSSAIAVTSNVSWTVTDNQTWITTSATSGSNNGSFNVTVTANTGAARTGSVTVTGGGITQTISVSQAAAPGAVAIPGTIQAETWTAMSGVQTEATTDTGGGSNVGWIDAGDWMDYSVNVSTAGSYTVSFRMASGASGGTIQLRNSAGTTLCSATVGGTGGWQTWTTINATATLAAGTQTLRLYASTGGYNVNWVQFAVNTGGTTYYTIKNRWTNAYLYDAGANAGYGASVANNNYKWEKVAVDGTYFYLKNLGTGEYMHIENQTGAVQSSAITLGWWSAQWSQENVDGTYSRIRNRWQTGSIIHVENQNGSAQYAGAQDGWYSAQWQFATTAARTATNELEETTEGAQVVEIYPVPSVGNQINIVVSELKDNETAPMMLHDVNGSVVMQKSIHKRETIEHQLPAGFYLMRVMLPGKSVTKKVLIER